MSWKLTAFGDKASIQSALLAQEDALDWDPDIVLTGFELADDRPDEWRLDAYLPRKPTRGDREAVANLFADEALDLVAERLPDTDWVTESQQGMEPIRAGRFYVHTPDHPPSDEPGERSFVIPASQAFGTGQHETTAGCLVMLDEMKRRGVVARRIADIGTGTGLLAFAALELWPGAHAVASDIDPVCGPVVAENAAANGFALGPRPGQIAVAIAAGMDDPDLRACGPYDLLIANILAGPLLELAGDFAEAVPPRGNLLLAGLLETQEPKIRAAYLRAGFSLAARLVRGDWSILWLRRRFVG
ncbi:50S ribosomal protein L11 methyltransferase [Croceibacterium aestuarii]|uniref:50S ribosomal protein L11 methyltransferase n=1 Tax=Croceibacterium aestuarii TaxID=3064139 RepID=UPI00272E4281|nr:50S ribosomal protein L11 methyltransferase [Croceibacterium sp. D39]